MILNEIGNHVSPAQALAAVVVTAGFFAGKTAHLGAEWAWCSLTGRQIRPCGCRHCRSVRHAASLPRQQDLAQVIPFPLRGEVA